MLSACAAGGTAPPAPGSDELSALGRLVFFDAGLSEPAGQSCATCHDPGRGFTDPRPFDTSEGIIAGLFGSRNTPTAAYAAFAPPLRWDAGEGLYIGGLFLDGRAPTLEDQAQGPPVNPIEMHNPDKVAYVAKVARAPYAERLKRQFGPDLFNHAELAYQRISEAVAAFERGPEASPFSSKYDAWLQGRATLSAQERRGLDLYEGRGNCAACHPNLPGEDHRLPVFTDFSYDNIGVPRNPRNPFYTIRTEFNPQGAGFIDPGLGGNARVIADGRAAENLGRFKVPTLRNVAITGPYMHNGVFRTLKEVVSFYNLRDLDPVRFGPPETGANVNRDELGNLGLSDEEEDALVAFLRTLTDGWHR